MDRDQSKFLEREELHSVVRNMLRFGKLSHEFILGTLQPAGLSLTRFLNRPNHLIAMYCCFRQVFHILSKGHFRGRLDQQVFEKVSFCRYVLLLIKYLTGMIQMVMAKSKWRSF